MDELIQEAFRLYNLPLTVSFLLILAFWGMTVLGVVDTDSLEPDLDLDTDADAHTLGFGLFRFFNVGEVPLMILLSVLITLVWAGALVSNFYMNPGHSYVLALGYFLANGFVSLFLTKFLTAPLKPLMRSLKAGEKHTPVVGRTCVVKTSEVTEDFGQAEADDDGAPLLLHVRLSQGQPPLKKGDRALVIDTQDDSQTYIVRKLDS